MLRTNNSAAVLFSIAGLLGGACEGYCPRGYSHIGDKCYPVKDAGADAASPTATDAGDDGRASPDNALPGEHDGGDRHSTNDDDCPENACVGGKCIDGLDDYRCECADGYAGSGTKRCTKVDPCPDGAATCQVDPCNPSPCDAGFACTRSSGIASCGATCARSELGCQLGDPCSTDEECRSGGDENASCDPTGKVCVTVCPTTSIVSELNLEAAKYCREIDGDLIVSPNFATIPADALPYLKRIRGRFNADPSGVPNTSAQSITFSALQTLDGSLSLGLFLNVTLLSFPRLTTVGGDLQIVVAPAMEHLSLPQLTIVEGNVQAGRMPISQLDLGRLQTIGGTLTLGPFCNLPWSQASRLESLVANPIVGNIGCCTGQTTQHACDDSCKCN